jgi:mRNA interferase MazF
MTGIPPGEFWLAEIPFTDGSASKIRPVLILWRDGLDLVVAAVTSVPPGFECLQQFAYPASTAWSNP